MSSSGPLAAGSVMRFTLVLARMGGLVLLAPVFGAAVIPARARVGIAVALSLLVAPVAIGDGITLPHTPLEYGVVLAGEAAVGLFLGLGMVILLSGLRLAGEAAGQQMGMGLQSVFDPQQGSQSSVLGRFYYLVGLAIFLMIDGHRLVVEALLDSFAAIPVGGLSLMPAATDALVTLLGQAFSLAVCAGAPVVTALLLAGMATGILGRTVPQLNVLVIGFSVRTMLGLAVVAASLVGVGLVMRGQLPEFIGVLRAGLGLE